MAYFTFMQFPIIMTNRLRLSKDLTQVELVIGQLNSEFPVENRERKIWSIISQALSFQPVLHLCHCRGVAMFGKVLKESDIKEPFIPRSKNDNYVNTRT